MIAAFRGAPKSLRPVNIGEKETGKGGDKQLSGVTPTVLLKLPGQSKIGDGLAPKVVAPAAAPPSALERMAHDVEAAMQDLIDAKLVRVRLSKLWVEVEINTDILFPSGSSGFSEPAVPVLDKLAEVLKPFPNPIRVEGHTDDRPIHTTAFPSNWELSAARKPRRSCTEFTKVGVDPLRLEIVGFGEYHPVHANDSVAGRNMNRRVTILILEKSLAADAPGTASPQGPRRLALRRRSRRCPLPRVRPRSGGKSGGERGGVRGCRAADRGAGAADGADPGGRLSGRAVGRQPDGVPDRAGGGLMIRRRGFLAAAGALAAPRIGLGADSRVLRFIPQSDLAVLDPIWTAAYVTRNHAMMVFDTLYGTDGLVRRDASDGCGRNGFRG